MLVLLNYIIVNIDKDVVWLMETDLGFNKLHNCQHWQRCHMADGDWFWLNKLHNSQHWQRCRMADGDWSLFY